MTQYGSGTGTPVPISPLVIGGAVVPSCLTIARYIERFHYRECAFWGVNNPADRDYSCRAIWSLSERELLAFALAEAQEELEQEIGYFLCPKWVTEERHPYRCPTIARWGYVIEGGVRSVAELANSAVVSYTSDPATVGPIALAGCDPDSIHLFHEDTDYEIYPHEYTVTGGAITFQIPWCRLIHPDYWDNPIAGWPYASIPGTYGQTHVDVQCITNDISTQASLIWRTSCDTNCDTVTCSDTRKNGCLYVRQPRLGIVDTRQASYSGGAWTALSDYCTCRKPDWVELNYLSGITVLSKQAEDAIVRLGHSKMADEPCACEVTQRYWKRDRAVPTTLTRERVNCPFGQADGSWTAYRFAQTMKLVRGSVL